MGTAKISVTIKELKYAEVIVSLFNLPVWTLQTLDASQRMKVDDYRHKHVVVPVITAVVGVMSVLEHNDKASETW